MLRAWLITFLGVPGLGAQLAGAQEAESPLPVSGSLIYNALTYNRIHGTDSRGAAMRFAGRVAIRVGANTYAGLAGGSWLRVGAPSCADVPDCGDFISLQSEAIVYQIYIQRYVSRAQLFLRAGAGVANTTTLLPEDRIVIAVARRWRAALSAGAGIDLRIAHFVYLTPSLDVTVLPATDTRAQELRTGFAAGLGLTLR
jgi:hypothetical protein